MKCMIKIFIFYTAYLLEITWKDFVNGLFLDQPLEIHLPLPSWPLPLTLPYPPYWAFSPGPYLHPSPLIPGVFSFLFSMEATKRVDLSLLKTQPEPIVTVVCSSLSPLINSHITHSLAKCYSFPSPFCHIWKLLGYFVTGPISMWP